MMKWAVSAIVYLLVIVGGYTVYANYFDKDTSSEQETHSAGNAHNSEHKESENAGGHNDSHGDHGALAAESEVAVDVNYDGENVVINMKDKEGNPVKDLEVNHEKFMHLIIVDDHLDKYYHLHPTKMKEGAFQVDYPLEKGSYKAFVDIKPVNLTYHVSPLAFAVGEPAEGHSHPGLEVDSELTKTVNGKKVEMKPSTDFKAGEPITLDFVVDKEGLEPYLGAMGHVVILDEAAENYVHVHPSNEKEPKFETEFNKQGKYKIWAEFKHHGIVRTYPFVIEVK
ncbi:hypothetical protein [Peribacillus sp. SCS-155]|uniref:hypothetical protein n=1 Tax=Peribacillus sedimenti TaxID=3115297 RepID=UPI003906C27A